MVRQETHHIRRAGGGNPVLHLIQFQFDDSLLDRRRVAELTRVGGQPQAVGSGAPVHVPHVPEPSQRLIAIQVDCRIEPAFHVIVKKPEHLLRIGLSVQAEHGTQPGIRRVGLVKRLEGRDLSLQRTAKDAVPHQRTKARRQHGDKAFTIRHRCASAMFRVIDRRHERVSAGYCAPT